MQMYDRFGRSDCDPGKTRLSVRAIHRSHRISIGFGGRGQRTLVRVRMGNSLNRQQRYADRCQRKWLSSSKVRLLPSLPDPTCIHISVLVVRTCLRVRSQLRRPVASRGRCIGNGLSFQPLYHRVVNSKFRLHQSRTALPPLSEIPPVRHPDLIVLQPMRVWRCDKKFVPDNDRWNAGLKFLHHPSERDIAQP